MMLFVNTSEEVAQDRNTMRFEVYQEKWSAKCGMQYNKTL